jgi:hypothetical protein
LDPRCQADVDKAWPPGDPMNESGRALAIQACPVLQRMDAVLDPEGEHLRAVDSGLRPQPPDAIAGFRGHGDTGLLDGVEAQSFWTPDGHYPETPANIDQEVGPFLTVDIELEAPGTPDDYSGGTESHVPDPNLHLKDGQAAPATPWGPATTTTLADGSTVKVRREVDPDGATYAIIRTLPSGFKLTLYVDGPQPPGTGMVFPFTEQQLVAAVSVPWTEAVGLPVPDGIPTRGVRTPAAPSGSASAPR